MECKRNRKLFTRIRRSCCCRILPNWNLSTSNQVQYLFSMLGRWPKRGPKGSRNQIFITNFWNFFFRKWSFKKCPNGLVYNATKEYCDWPENVDCSVQCPVPQKCKKGDVRSHETECKKYYECGKYGKESLKTCPMGKIFDSKQLNCDFAYKPWVNCK